MRQLPCLFLNTLRPKLVNSFVILAGKPMLVFVESPDDGISHHAPVGCGGRKGYFFGFVGRYSGRIGERVISIVGVVSDIFEAKLFFAVLHSIYSYFYFLLKLNR